MGEMSDRKSRYEHEGGENNGYHSAYQYRSTHPLQQLPAVGPLPVIPIAWTVKEVWEYRTVESTESCKEDHRPVQWVKHLRILTQGNLEIRKMKRVNEWNIQESENGHSKKFVPASLHATAPD